MLYHAVIVPNMLFDFEHLNEDTKNAGTELNSYDDLQADIWTGRSSMGEGD